MAPAPGAAGPSLTSEGLTACGEAAQQRSRLWGLGLKTSADLAPALRDCSDAPTP